MPITPGSSSKLNSLYGLSSIMVSTASEEVTLANKILPAGLLLKKSDGRIYLTDGVSTLANIPVLVDNVLTTVEKIFLSSAVSNNGTYQAAAGGVVVHNSSGKIDDASLNVVNNNKIVESYLSDYIDPTTHKVLLSALPDTVRAGVTYVADITARDALSAEQKKSLAFVIDATDDTTVGSGAAMYGWDVTANNNEGAWVKIAEVESLDLDIDAIRCNYANVQAACAVMYDHTIHLNLNTATEFANLVGASDSTDEVTDTVHDEFADYSEQSWGHFITGLNTMLSNTSSEDVYVGLGFGYDDYIAIESENLNRGLTTFTMTNTVTSVSETLAVTDVVAGTTNRSIIIISGGVDNDSFPGLLSTDSNDNTATNQPITVTITDGTYTYRNTSYTRGSLRNALRNSLEINVDTDSDWQLVQ